MDEWVKKMVHIYDEKLVIQKNEMIFERKWMELGITTNSNIAYLLSRCVCHAIRKGTMKEEAKNLKE